jgi:site-specific recombinase XerD
MVIEPKKKRRKNPVTALSKGLEEDLRQQGYAASTIWKQRRLLNDLIGWLQAQELAMDDLSMAQVDRFMADRRAAGVRKLKTRKALGPILGHLRGLGLAPAAEAPVEDGSAGEILNRYRQFLTTERGLADVTADRYIDCLRPFLDRRMAAGELDLGGLTPADVTSFVVAWCPCLNAGVAKLTVTALRSFLGFLHLDGATERSLVPAVPKVLRRRLAGLPKGLEPDQVRRLLAACDTGTGVGIRDLAILTLLIRLGLRRGEVAELGLDDIDWRAGTIRVRGKGDCHERLPLPADVGDRLAEYLRHARPVEVQV